MKSIFDAVSKDCSRIITQTYSTSFSMATKMLANSIRQDIYNIYGFVRLADEIVDSFHDYDKEALFIQFEADLESALNNKISLNPILNSFQQTYHTYSIDKDMVDAFMNSMRQDLYKTVYHTDEEYKNYIYGSADVVGLMCLKVFVNGNHEKYEALKDTAMFRAPNPLKIQRQARLCVDQILMHTRPQASGKSIAHRQSQRHCLALQVRP